DGVTVQDAGGRLVYANAAAATALGFASAAEMVAVPPGDLLAHYSILDESGVPIPIARLPGRRALAGEAEPEMTVRFRVLTTGEERWSSLRATPIRDAEGRVRGVVNVWHDVTALMRNEATQRLLADAGAALAASLDVEATLAAVARMAVPALADWCVVFLADEDRRIRRVELAAADPAREALLRQIQDRFPPAWDGPLPAARAIRTGQAVISPETNTSWLAEYIDDEEYRQMAGEIGLRSVLAVPLAARGRTLGALSFGAATPGRFGPQEVAVAEELARRAALAVDNARLYAEAQAAIAARDRFLSIAAHELRTPIAVTKAFAELLARERVKGDLAPERVAHLVGRIVGGAERLDRLTNDLLDVARLRLGQLPLRPEPIDLAALTHEVAERYRERVAGTHRVTVTAEAPCPVIADPDRIEQVLVNLVENGLKYSPTGGTIRVTVEPEGEGTRVSVTDEGIGLPPGAAEAIFEPFGRAANAAESGIPGLGLGLYIGRSFVERHGGRIWAESAGETRGTTVSFWLPCDGSGET
ncbi:MAG TPA: ATP-binding protein, partial [Thermomicrobiales bacterium]|nr:ATP-binding protein [Thermomicrobiales bacterium]